jgi:oleandomycin transport system ATP-binding protein
VAGHDVARNPAAVRRVIGAVGQRAGVDLAATGAENLRLQGQLHGLLGGELSARVSELLEQFGLAEAGGRLVRTYSGGMRRRLDLAASLVSRPKVVFLDEPTTGLDPGKREEVWRMIRAISQGGGTVLLTTQYLEEADALADEISVIDHGRVIAHGTPPELKHVVGGQTIVARPRDAARLPDVAAILRDAAGRPPEAASSQVLTVPVDDDGVFACAVRELDHAGIAMSELSLRLPSLDEVFFALTGRSAKARNQGEEDAA